MCAHVLVAEDDEKQARLVRLYLEREGHVVTVVHDGRDAIDAARTKGIDILVLDVMMPRVDGLDVTRVLRRESELPILMLTARSTEDDLLLGLDLGADDYLTKPYSPRELMARVRTLLRRSGRPATVPDPDPVLRVGELSVDPVRHEVAVAGRGVDCTPGEFRILEALIAEPGRVYTRQQLLDRARGFDRYVSVRTVDVHIMNLRRKIEADPQRPAYLVTVFGVGYKMAEPGAGSRGERRGGA
ncbi:response regulator transcription factor [Embleya sp. AB8]|uniref:response regulator transcription factor n=1 Tax=Embleya sp. AB8 TaxID=3156304 RepID=UPI003C755959